MVLKHLAYHVSQEDLNGARETSAEELPVCLPAMAP